MVFYGVFLNTISGYWLVLRVAFCFGFGRGFWAEGFGAFGL
jgi:hypothetical protein